MKAIWMTIGAAAGWLFGAALPYLPILFVLILIDTVFGIANARKNGGITSNGFRKLPKKMLFYAGSIIAVNLVITTLQIVPAALVVLVFALIGCEALSILENARTSGYLPKAACKVLERITGAIKDERNSADTS